MVIKQGAAASLVRPDFGVPDTGLLPAVCPEDIYLTLWWANRILPSYRLPATDYRRHSLIVLFEGFPHHADVGMTAARPYV